MAHQQVRQQWGLGNGPIDNFQFVLESHGIIVASSKYVASEIDAFSQKVRLGKGRQQGYGYIIAVAVGEKLIEHLRFDMAHDRRFINPGWLSLLQELSGLLVKLWYSETEKKQDLIQSEKLKK